jgi:hypothetical protein
MTELPKIKKVVEVPVKTWGDLVEYATQFHDPMLEEYKPKIRVGDTVIRKDTLLQEGHFPRGSVGVVVRGSNCGVVKVMWPSGMEILSAYVATHFLEFCPMPPDKPLFD